MKFEQLNKVRDYLRALSIKDIEGRVYNMVAKTTPTESYITLVNKPLSFWDVQNMDLLEVAIYWIGWWPDLVWEVADNVLLALQSNWLYFDDFRTFWIICTGKTPTLTIEGKFKITMFFQIRYLK